MKRKKRKLKNGTNPKAKHKRYVSTAPMPWGGDHGTGTAAATAGTELVEIKNDDGKNPNHLARRTRINLLDRMRGLTQRQRQAADAIRNAYGRVETLSSGGPLKEQVQSSPKPDATVAMQVDAQSRLEFCMRAVLPSERAIVEQICWFNQAPRRLSDRQKRRWYSRFREAMDRVADHLRY